MDVLPRILFLAAFSSEHLQEHYREHLQEHPPSKVLLETKRITGLAKEVRDEELLTRDSTVMEPT
jgi:hypothetical protein